MAQGTIRHGEILFPRTAPNNTVAPAVTGTTAVGKVLTTTNGTWTNDVSGGYTYQWRRETGIGTGSYTNISSATASTYTQVNADRTLRVICVVTASGTGGSSAANSNTVGPVGTSTGNLLARMDMQGQIIDEWAGDTGDAGSSSQRAVHIYYYFGA